MNSKAYQQEIIPHAYAYSHTRYPQAWIIHHKVVILAESHIIATFT